MIFSVKKVLAQSCGYSDRFIQSDYFVNYVDLSTTEVIKFCRKINLWKRNRWFEIQPSKRQVKKGK